MRNKHLGKCPYAFGPHVTIDMEETAWNFSDNLAHALHWKTNLNSYLDKSMKLNQLLTWYKLPLPWRDESTVSGKATCNNCNFFTNYEG